MHPNFRKRMKVNEEIVLVAHGENQPSAVSNPGIKTISQSGEPLDLGQARQYMETGSGALYSSSSLGPLGALSRQDYQALFGGPARDGLEIIQDKNAVIQDTGERLGAKVDGQRIFALRQGSLSIADLSTIIDGHGIQKITVLACRGADIDEPTGPDVSASEVRCVYVARSLSSALIIITSYTQLDLPTSARLGTLQTYIIRLDPSATQEELERVKKSLQRDFEIAPKYEYKMSRFKGFSVMTSESVAQRLREHLPHVS